MFFAALILFFIFTFAVVALTVLLIGTTLERKPQVALEGDDPTGALLLKNDQLSSISAWHDLLARFDFIEIMRKQTAQADLQWSAGRLTLSMLLAGAVVFALVSTSSWIPFWAQVGIAWLAALGPYWYVLRIRAKRFEAFTSQFPDALDSITRAMKSGYPLMPAIDQVTKEVAPPMSSELRKVCVEVSLGVPVAVALTNFCERVPLVEVELFAASVQLHSRTGGRLAEVLSSLSENIRDQIALEGEVRALAAQGRVTGVILSALPVFIAGMLAVVSPGYIGLLLGHPYGKHMIAAALFCLVLAHVVIRRIVDIRV